MLALAMHRDCQGNGMDAALVAAAAARLGAQGQRILIVETSGTEDYARIRDFRAAGDDKVIFRNAL